MVGSTLTICDIYLCLTQVEMQQCLMDTNIKNSLEFINTIFKHVTTEVDPWMKRMGAVKPGKKQIMPVFTDNEEGANDKDAGKAAKAAKKDKANAKK